MRASPFATTGSSPTTSAAQCHFRTTFHAVQVHPANPQLSGLPELGTRLKANFTDLLFRGYDLNNADTYLEEEFERDVNAGGLKNLSVVRMPHNHTGNYTTALSGVNTPELKSPITITPSENWSNSSPTARICQQHAHLRH